MFFLSCQFSFLAKSKRFELGTGFTTASVCLSRRFFFYFSFLADDSRKCGRGFGVGFVPGGGVGPFRCIYFVSGQHSAGMFVSPSCFSFLAVSEHTHTQRRNSVHLPTVEYGAVCGRRGLGRSHMFTAAVCARGGAAAGRIGKVRETAGVQRRALQCLWLGCWRSVRETS